MLSSEFLEHILRHHWFRPVLPLAHTHFKWPMWNVMLLYPQLHQPSQCDFSMHHKLLILLVCYCKDPVEMLVTQVNGVSDILDMVMLYN